MKKKLLITIIAVLTVITCAFGLVACKDDPSGQSDTPEGDSAKFEGTYKYYGYINQWYDIGCTYIFKNGKYTVKYPPTVHEDITGEYKINKDGALEFSAREMVQLDSDSDPVEMTMTVVCEYVEDGVLKMTIEPNVTPVTKLYLCKEGLLPPGVSESDISRT